MYVYTYVLNTNSDLIITLKINLIRNSLIRIYVHVDVLKNIYNISIHTNVFKCVDHVTLT